MKTTNQFFLIIGICFLLNSCISKKSQKETEYQYVPLITKICPYPGENVSPWIELYNPLKKEVDISNLKIVLNDEYQTKIPKSIQYMPAKSYIIIHFDGQKGNSENLKFKNKQLTLHSEIGIKADLLKIGQISLIAEDKTGEKIIGFVSWAAPGSKKTLSKERDAIWNSKWFICLEPSFGDINPNPDNIKGKIIGLYPGAKKATIQDYFIYNLKELTHGQENPVPNFVLFTLANNATINCKDVSIGWTPNGYSQSFKFQIATDREFTQLTEEKELKEALYKPTKALAPGTYYYRIKIIDKEKRESNWTKPMRLICKNMGNSVKKEDGAITEKVLTAMQWKRQRKDTKLLCLDGCASDLDATTTKHWDNIHPDGVPIGTDHGSMNCVRTSISMMVSFYGKTLSIDRIAYFTEEERAGEGDGEPEGDLAHRIGNSYPTEETAALEWALGESVTLVDFPNPTFNDIKGWLDTDRPIMTRTPGHLRTINGYRIDDLGEQWVHILDPWSGERWETYTTWNTSAYGTWIGPEEAPAAREDETSVWIDSDADGIMNFDEDIRFQTGKYDIDSDNDLVGDKNDMREYVFDSSDAYNKRDADYDSDGDRKEVDADNDFDVINVGLDRLLNDGCEDRNRNGKFEPDLGETSNFNSDLGPSCDLIPEHIIMVLDRSGSMNLPYNGETIQKYDQAMNAVLFFFDEFSIISYMPDNSKVGLVYYDHTAYFDAGATTNTTLELVSDAKRDKIAASMLVNRPTYGSTSIGGGLLKSMEAQGFNISGTSATDQHRAVIVITDGKENTSPYMDNPTLIQNIIDGQVNGYVIGIGSGSQLDNAKLMNLAAILNYPHPFYTFNFSSDVQLALLKFFELIILEVAGTGFGVEPTEIIASGQVNTHQINVSPETERVLFSFRWDKPNAKINLTLKDPEGKVVPATKTKIHTVYNLQAVDKPKPGKWTVIVNAGSAQAGVDPGNITYNYSSIERNAKIGSNFTAYPNNNEIGKPTLLMAKFSYKGIPVKNIRIKAYITKPSVSIGNLISDIQIPKIEIKSPEKNITLTDLQKKYEYLEMKKIQPALKTEEVLLHDDGINGDKIAGDGIYSFLFTNTTEEGIYNIRYVAEGKSNKQASNFTREEVVQVSFNAVVDPVLSQIKVIDKKFVDNTTIIKCKVTPLNKFGKKMGPGYADILKTSVKDAKIISITDNLNGSYDIELSINGKFDKKFYILQKR